MVLIAAVSLLPPLTSWAMPPGSGQCTTGAAPIRGNWTQSSGFGPRGAPRPGFHAGIDMAAAVGTGIYEADEASTLRREVILLQENQGSQVAQIARMSRDAEDAANRLASMVDDMERSQNNPGELAKLRGEVARLKTASSRTDSSNRELVAWLERVKRIELSS